MRKNYFKQLIAVFVALLCCVTASAHDFEVDGIFYNISGDEAVVTYKGSSYSEYSNEYSDSVVIPENVTYNGISYIVTSIGDYAFEDCCLQWRGDFSREWCLRCSRGWQERESEIVRLLSIFGYFPVCQA